MRKIWAPIVTGALVLGGALAASPAMADEGGGFEAQTICDVWGADTHNYRVVQTGLRSFEVRIVDLLMFAAGPGEDGGEPGFSGPDHYVPIPESIRFATNTISLGEGAAADNFTLSQGVVTVPDENDMPLIGSVNQALPNPGEGYDYDPAAGMIVWTQDTDAQVVDGAPIEPAFPPFINIDKSAGVLTFDVTLPDEAEGEVDVISGIAMTWNTHKYNVSPIDGFTWHPEPIEVLNDTLAACSVELEPLAIEEEPGEEDPTEVPDEEEPGEEDPTEVPDEEEPGEEDPTEKPGKEEPGKKEPTEEFGEGELASTGTDVGTMAVTALVLLTAGSATLLVARRRNSA